MSGNDARERKILYIMATDDDDDDFICPETNEMAFVEPLVNGVSMMLDIDRLQRGRLKLESRTANFGPRPLLPVLPILTVSFRRPWQTNRRS